MSAKDTIVQLIVFVGFAIFAYSKVTGKTIKETLLEIRELFNR